MSDNSAEVGNKRNQLATTTEHLNQLEKTRGELEQTAQSGQDELSQLETNLSNARVKHEAETKAVAELRARVSEQKDKLQELQGSVIAAESDLSGMRSEKDELEQALLRDKEEVRELQRRMKEVNDEKVSLKTLLEKLRKDARQQKGMVSIAKKQLTTGEASRDAAQKDIDSHAAQASEAAAVPLPATPRALSPNATGVSQRSNNPFDRLGAARSESREPSVVAIPAVAPPAPTSPPPHTEPELERGVADQAEAAAPVPNAVTVAEPEPVESTSPAAPHKARVVSDEDPFGAKSDDPFDSTTFAETSAPSEPAPVEGVAQHEDGTAKRSGATDFDAAFADFDDEFTPAGAKEKDALTKAPPMVESPEQTTSQLGHIETEAPKEAENVESAAPPTAGHAEKSTEDSAPEGAAPAAKPVDELLSSDDDEGPEDLENAKPHKPREEHVASPVSLGGLAMPSLAQPLDKTRRSAPAPPTRGSTNEEPEYAPTPPTSQAAPMEQFAPPAAAAPSKFASFDDDDFDFTDQPPAAVDTRAPQQPAKTFDDEFAAFDDEFESKSSQPNTGSDNSKTFEMISPPSAGPETQQVKAAPIEDRDEWGLLSAGGSNAHPAPPALSFDDAFGGAFEPHQPSYQPPPGSPPSALHPPPPPERRATGAQNDDIEDVKKVSLGDVLDRLKLTLCSSAGWVSLAHWSSRRLQPTGMTFSEH